MFLGRDEKWQDVLAHFSNVYDVLADDVIMCDATKGVDSADN